ncbi:MAG: hypothetical protein QOK10_1724 [Pseudonocardiales bacterium]|nr:hypothetical protein [Pseudonocardiales bacterium]
MKTTRMKFASILVALAACVGSLIVGAPAAQALSGSSFDPGYIISDATFSATGTMTEAQIQAFLVANEPSCSGSVACMRNYTVTTQSRAASKGGQCSAYTGAANEPASRVIYKVSQACKVNPQVLLVLLQKEEGLITSGAPTAGMYKIAAGYGCPDTAACDTSYYGFYNQVYWATWQFREYMIDPSYWHYKIGNVAIQWSPNAACGSSVVNIRNQATAALYNYTPYQPNAAALANLSGLGNSCSSYGNRNFWVYFNNWFGSPTGAVNPIGNVDLLTAVPGGVRVAGWVYDPDTTAPIEVDIYANSTGYSFQAADNRPDLVAAFGAIGSAHGFDVTIPVTSSAPQNVCVYGINVGAGGNTQVKCVTVPGWTGSPYGAVDTLTAAAGKLNVSGWAIDPDSASPVTGQVSIDGAMTPFTADQSRADIAAAYPSYGGAHGYSVTANLSPGMHNVCVYATNIAGSGSTTTLGCKTVTVATGLPIGVIDNVSAIPGYFSVAGWALDPDTASPIQVHVYVDSVGVALIANLSRTDIATAFPGYGANHGYDAAIPATPGQHQVCLYAIDANDTSTHSSLGCRTMTALSGSPFGVVDSIAPTAGGYSYAGWAIDPDTAQPISIRVTVDSTSTSALAGVNRPDVGAAYSLYGSQHGYSGTVSASAGSHKVCVYGVNVSAGSDTLLGCKTLAAG